MYVRRLGSEPWWYIIYSEILIIDLTIFVSYVPACLFAENVHKELVFNPLIVIFRFFCVTETF